ncbi:hypothetical protein JOC34_000502 [Virgibacillus halotolerans]|uniref:hypothetical protein n=1 Tax=Virgibacillus halotolerans TaxID=1071053 RepID=UPI00195F6228|nr:hypothetical protein [Virgibacillus halotolerans]MBM7598145.1 hypothetical protein [Virgibacillus halotolerans]
MKQFTNIPCDLYIHKDELPKMEQGEQGTGYKEVTNNEQYILYSKHAFLQITENEIIDKNSYKVLFIME